MDLSAYLVAWRTTALRDREVVDALVHPTHAGPSPALAGALAAWPGRYYWSDEPDGRHLVLTRPVPLRPRDRWLLHVVLFLTTLLTTTYAGAVLVGTVPSPGTLTFFSLFIPGSADAARVLAPGLVFSLPLLAILLCHELGHYLTAKRYLLDVSPPFFIPVPLWPSFIGTMGAFIRLRTILTDRRQLFDVGVAGPIAGFLVALPALWVGLRLSSPLPPTLDIHGLVLWIGGEPIRLGDSLVTLAVRRVAVGEFPAVSLHPLAFAGWVGMFVTMLNLLPMGQLDGGHILFAALPRWHRRVAVGFWICVMLLGMFWRGWLFWGFIVLLLSRGRFVHPPVLDVYRPLPPSRRWLAWASLVLFLLTFAPIPFRA